MAMNLNRRRGGKKKRQMVPLGSIKNIIDEKIKAKVKDLEVASVVVTICDGTSFDKLFRTLPQESEYGRVGVYYVTPGQILSYMQRALQNEIVDKFTEQGTKTKIAPNLRQTLKQLKKDCDAAGPDAVCFNFECCGGYSEAGFCKGNTAYREVYLDLIAYLVKEFGCMTMFSDFSLKALVSDWDVKRFGANPFKQVGSFSGNLTLTFNPEILKKSPSAQLNTVGSLSEGGKAQLQAMGGTILFTLNDDAQDLVEETLERKENGKMELNGKYVEPYELEVLSVATLFQDAATTRRNLENVAGDSNLVKCKVGDTEGMGGHVLITFPPSEANLKRFDEDQKEQEEAKAKALKEGKAVNLEDEEEVFPVRGMMLASCGHWVELMKLDVNTKRLMETIEDDWGADDNKITRMNSAMRGMSMTRRASFTRKEAVKYVQSRPAARQNRKLKRMKKNGF